MQTCSDGEAQTRDVISGDHQIHALCRQTFVATAREYMDISVELEMYRYAKRTVYMQIAGSNTRHVWTHRYTQRLLDTAVHAQRHVWMYADITLCLGHLQTSPKLPPFP